MEKTKRYLGPVLVIMCSACGGGGGGSDSASSPQVPQLLTANPSSIVVSRTVGDPSPVISALLSFPGEGPLSSRVTSTGGIVLSPSVAIASATQGSVQFQLAQPANLAPGSHSGTLQVSICRDPACTTHVAGSPITIPIDYTVVAASPIGATLSPLRIEEWAAQSPAASGHPGKEVKLTVTFATALSFTPFVSVPPHALISSGYGQSTSASALELNIKLSGPHLQTLGEHTGTLSIPICYTVQCANQVTSEPLQIPISYFIAPDAVAESGIETVSPLQTRSVTHNVIDAGFSKALDSLVMVATYPRNALYVYDLASSIEREVALSKAPTAVSVAPSGLFAAVGHDALVTHVDLTQLGMAGVNPATELSTPAYVSDIVLDGRGFAHVLPSRTSSAHVRSIDVNANFEYTSVAGIFDRALGVLHPSGNHIYLSDISRDILEKFDIAAVPATRLYGSSPQIGHRSCGMNWISETGDRLFGYCGNVFRASSIQSEDMMYVGRLELPERPEFPVPIYYPSWSIADSPTANEIASIEYQGDSCHEPTRPAPCFTRLSTYDRPSLTRKTTRAFPPVTLEGIPYPQWGRFVFYRANGVSKVVISRRLGSRNPATEFVIHDF